MQTQATVYTMGDFVRRVVESLLRGEHRGRFFCARCLVKLSKDHLDKSYARSDVAEIVGDIFGAPGPITHASSATCDGCGRKKLPCLVVPGPEAPATAAPTA